MTYIGVWMSKMRDKLDLIVSFKSVQGWECVAEDSRNFWIIFVQQESGSKYTCRAQNLVDGVNENFWKYQLRIGAPRGSLPKKEYEYNRERRF